MKENIEKIKVADQVEDALAGNRAAEEWLARRSYEAGLRLATFSLSDPEIAQDVGQEVAIRVIRALAKLRDPECFDGWTYRICAAEIKRAAKKRGRTMHQPYDEATVPPSEPTFVAEVSDRDWLAQALTRLTDRERIVVGLRYVYDLPDEEIAAAIRCRPGTVRSLLSRAMARVRNHADAAELQAAARISG